MDRPTRASALLVARLPDYRAGVDAPPWLLQACESIRREVPERGRVLSLWTANYPASFRIDAPLASGELRLVWQSEALMLVGTR